MLGNVAIGGASGAGRGVLLAVSVSACIATGCGGVVRRDGLDDNGSSGQAGSGVVPPAGGAAGVGAAGFGGSVGGTGMGGGSGFSGGGSGGSAGSAGVVGSAGSAGSGTLGAAGSGGMGGLEVCDSRTCGPVNSPGGQLAMCCAESGNLPSIPRCGVDMGSLTGVDLDFYEPCQPKHQPGVPDAACETLVVSVAGGMASIQQGCCRTDVGVCGFQVDHISSGRTRIDPELGCVSATVSVFPRPLTRCGQAPRPHWVRCECTDGSIHGLCLAAGCGAAFDQGGVCAQACGGWDNRVSFECRDNDPRCR